MKKQITYRYKLFAMVVVILLCLSTIYLVSSKPNKVPAKKKSFKMIKMWNGTIYNNDAYDWGVWSGWWTFHILGDR